MGIIMQPTMTTKVQTFSTQNMPRRATTTTHIVADSVGALLRQAREEKSVTCTEISRRTKIPEQYLHLFENDAHGDLADDVYTKIYLKAYGKFLGFESATLLEHYRRERVRALGQARVDIRRIHPSTSVPDSQLVVTPRIVQSVLLGIVVVGLIAYFGVQITKIVTPPTITVSSPTEGLATENRTISIEGKTESEVALAINGKSISPDSNGNFKDTLDLQEGLNVITIIGAKKHSRPMTVTRRIIVLPPKLEPAVLGPAIPPKTP